MTSEDAIALSKMCGPESRQALAMVPSGGSTSPRQQSLYTEEGQGDEGPWEPVGTGLRQQGGNTHPDRYRSRVSASREGKFGN